jgi:hypothetical protein
MTLRTSILLITGALACVHAAAAQTPAARPTDTGRSVTLPLNEYNRLVDLANRPSDAPPAAPVPAVLANADLQVRVDKDAVRGTFTLAGDVMRPGTQRVTLLAGGGVLDATLDERPLPMIVDRDANAALIEGPGRFTATLQWGGALAFSPGRASFVLPVPPAGTVRGSIDVPGEQADVRVSPGLITGRTIVNGRTRIEVTFKPGSASQVSWSMRDTAPTAAAREVRALADVLTLVTLGESDARMAALVDINVVQGQPRAFDVQLPAGYETLNVTGNSLESSAQNGSTLTLTLNNPAATRHQFLIVLERAHPGGTFSLETGFVTLPGVQRERGEVGVTGVGTLELTTPPREGLNRIDVRELNPALQGLARDAILSAFRYQGSPGAPPQLALDVRRFDDAGVPAAIAQRVTATTLITSEGRALTQLELQIQNRAQPFMRVVLPPKASIVSVDVAGAPAKPALGTDGVRVPLLRAGFRPTGTYTVSFVYLHDGTPFAKKGDAEMELPKMDIPIGVIEWEIFAPEQYRMRAIGGNVIDRLAFGQSRISTAPPAPEAVTRASGTYPESSISGPPMIRGQVHDSSGGALPGVTIVASSPSLPGGNRSTVSDSNGRYTLSGLTAGVYSITFTLQGFDTLDRRSVTVRDGIAATIDAALGVSSVTQTVTVMAEAPIVNVQSAAQQVVLSGRDIRDLPTQRDLPSLLNLVPGFQMSGAGGESETGGAQVNTVTGSGQSRRGDEISAPSQAVINLQQRAAGVLPVRVDVPRAGTVHQFVRLLVVDEATSVDLRYKRK